MSRRLPDPTARRPGARWVLAFALLLSAPAIAQTPPAEPPSQPAPPAKDQPERIPLAEIAVQSERDKRLLKEARDALGPSEELAEIRGQLPALEREFEALRARTERAILHEASLAEIEEITLDWSVIGSTVLDVQRAVGARSEEVDAKVADLRASGSRWEATLQATSTETPRALVEQIGEVIDLARAVAETGKRKQSSVAKLQARVAKLAEERDVEVGRLEEQRRARMGQVFERDKAPLWHPDGLELLRLQDVVPRVRESAARDWEISRGYVAPKTESLAVHGLLFAALLAFAFTGYRRRNDPDLGPATGTVRVILHHPVSVTVILMTLVTVWTLPEIPRPLAQLQTVALLVPAVILLRRFVPRSANSLLYALLLIWVFDRLRVLLAPLPQAPRLVLIFEMLFVLAVCLVWLSSKRLDSVLPPDERAGGRRIAVLAARILVLLALVGIAAEAAGYHALAGLMASVAVVGPGAAVILYGGVRSLDGLVGFLLRVRPLRLLGMVQHHRDTLRVRFMRLVGFGAALWWLQVLLAQLNILDELWDFLVMGVTATATVGEISISLGDVLLAVLTVYLSFKLSLFVRFLLEEDVYPRSQLQKGQPYAFSTLTHYTIVTLGFVVAVLAFGLDFDRLALMLGAFSVGIGFGLQTIVNNFVSGLILLTERPVEVGDTVGLGEVFGEVQRIGIRSSMVRTWQGAEVIVPNAELISQQVINWTHSDRRRRMEIPLSVEYGTDPQRVVEVLCETASREPRLLTDPAPFVLFMGFGDNGLDFELRAWTAEFDAFLTVRSDLGMALVAAFQVAGIRIAYPQRDLHVRNIEGEPARIEASAEGRPELRRVVRGGEGGDEPEG